MTSSFLSLDTPQARRKQNVFLKQLGPRVGGYIVLYYTHENVRIRSSGGQPVVAVRRGGLEVNAEHRVSVVPRNLRDHQFHRRRDVVENKKQKKNRSGCTEIDATRDRFRVERSGRERRVFARPRQNDGGDGR